MMKQSSNDPVTHAVVGVQLPLENVEYTIEQYLLDNGQRLDTETRVPAGKHPGLYRQRRGVHARDPARRIGRPVARSGPGQNTP